MDILTFIAIVVALATTFYCVNYRILILIKLFVYKDYIDEIPIDTDEGAQKFKHSCIKLNGLYEQLDAMEKAYYMVACIMILAWSTVIYLKLF